MSDLKSTETKTSSQKEQTLISSPSAWLLAIFIFLIAGTLVTIYQVRTTDTHTPKVSSQTEVLSQERELALQNEIAKLVALGNIEACKQVASVTYKNVCVNNIALNKANETMDVSFCDQLDNNLMSRDSCIRKILTIKSIEQEDKAVCLEAKDLAIQKDCEDIFYSLMAEKRLDPSYCDNNADKMMADKCWNRYYASATHFPPANFSSVKSACGVFRGEKPVADCTALLEAFTSGNPQSISAQCARQQTRTFYTQCATEVIPSLRRSSQN